MPSSSFEDPVEALGEIMVAGGTVVGGFLGADLSASIGTRVGASVEGDAGALLGATAGGSLGLVVGGTVGGGSAACAFGALRGVAYGSIGTIALSFFNSNPVHFPVKTFAKMGLIEMLGETIANMMVRDTINNIMTDTQWRKVIGNAAAIFIHLAALNFAAKKVGQDPSGSVTTAMMFIPLLKSTLKLLDSLTSHENPAPSVYSPAQ